MRIAVIGGGPAGMTAAYQVSKQLGTKVAAVDLYEKSDRVGGLSKSMTLGMICAEIPVRRLNWASATELITTCSMDGKTAGNAMFK